MRFPGRGFGTRRLRAVFAGAGRALVGASLAATWSVAAPASISATETVELPPLVVVDERNGPEWQYVAMRDCEILSASPRRQAEAFAEDLQRQHDRLALVVPDEFLGHFAQPSVYIVFDQSTALAMPPEIVATATVGRPLVEVKRDGAGNSQLELSALASRLRFRIAPSLFLFGSDQSGVAIELGSRGGPHWNGFQRSDGLRMRLSFEYVRKRLQRRVPRLPEWYVDAVPHLWSHSSSEANGLTLRPREWLDSKGRKPSARDPSTLTWLAPAEFCAPMPPGSSGVERATRTAHRELFLRWGLEHRDARVRAGFIALVRASVTAPVSTELLRECLGFDEAALRMELNRAVVRFHSRPSFLPLSSPARTKAPRSRPASLAESARLLGEWQRLAASHLKEHEAVRRRYLDEARRSLRRPLDQGMRDVPALATLALVETDADNPSVARPLLEEAMHAGSTRPAVLLALAALRWREAMVRPAGEAGRLSVTQSREILAPLQPLRGQPAPERAMFELFAKVWIRGEMGEEAEVVATVREALRLYPDDRTLLELGTNALARARQLELARDLVRVALPRFTAPVEREALELHLRRLEAESAGR